MDNKYLINSKSFYWLLFGLFQLIMNLGILQISNAQISIKNISTQAECGITINMNGPENATLVPYAVLIYKDGLLVEEMTNIYPGEHNCFIIPQPNYNRFDVQVIDAQGGLSPVIEDFQIGEQHPIITEENVSLPLGHCKDFFGDCLDESGIYKHTLTSVYGCDSTIILKLSVEGDLMVELNISKTPCYQQIGVISAETIGGFSPYTYQWSNGSSSNINTNLAVGSYDLTVTDQRGQSVIETDIFLGGEPVYHDLGTIENCFGNPIRIGSKNYGGKRTGAYADTLMTTAGCDSIVSFDLVVYDLTTEIIQSKVSCDANFGTATINSTGGQAPYTYFWSDQNSSTTNNTRNNLTLGEYSVTVQDAFGCELVKEIDFTHQILTDTAIANICDGAEYIFNGESFDQPGIYDRTVFNEQGCPTKLLLILDIIHTDYSTTLIHSDCAANNGSIDVSIRDQRNYRFNWNSGQETADISNLSPGFYTLSLTNSLTNCTSTEVIEIESLNPSFSVALLPIHEDCGSGNGQISAIIKGGIEPTYTWRDENNNILGATPSVENLSTGTYSIEVKDEIGCTVIKDTLLTSIDSNKVVIDTIVCKGACFKIGAECYEEAGFYTHTLTNSFGCDSTVLLNLEVHQLTVGINYTLSDCGADNGTASAEITESHHGGPYSYYWTSKNFNRTIQGPSIRNLSPGVYYLRVNDGVTSTGFACTIRDSVVIENLPIDSTFINICEGKCITIGANEYCEPGFYRDTIMATSGCDSIVVVTIDKAIFYPEDCMVEFRNPCSAEVFLEACQPFGTTGYWSTLEEGIQFETPENNRTWAYDLLEEDNIIIWNLEKGACTLSDTANVFYEGAPTAVPDTYELPYQVDTILNVLANDDLYNAPTQITLFTKDASLTVDDDTILQYQAPQGFFGRDTLSYMVCNMHCAGDISARNVGTENCDSATIVVTVAPYQTENDIPDIITPNGDGLNDEWIVNELLINPDKYPENKLTIYNRWGGQVFHAKPYLNNWSGLNKKGHPLPESTYYYILYLDIGEGETYTGEILVNR